MHTLMPSRPSLTVGVKGLKYGELPRGHPLSRVVDSNPPLPLLTRQGQYMTRIYTPPNTTLHYLHCLIPRTLTEDVFILCILEGTQIVVMARPRAQVETWDGMSRIPSAPSRLKTRNTGTKV